MDNILFISGLIISACAVVFGAVYFLVYKVSFKKLNITLDREYGQKNNRRPEKGKQNNMR